MAEKTFLSYKSGLLGLTFVYIFLLPLSAQGVYDQAVHDAGNVVLTFTNNSPMGSTWGGKGCEFPAGSGKGYLFALGLTVGTLDSVITSYFASEWDSDEKIVMTEPGVISSEDSLAIYHDGNTARNTGKVLGIRVEQRGYAWSYVPLNNFIIFDYTIKNTSSAELRGLYVGFPCDADVGMGVEPQEANFDDLPGFTNQKNGEYDPLASLDANYPKAEDNPRTPWDDTEPRPRNISYMYDDDNGRAGPPMATGGIIGFRLLNQVVTSHNTWDIMSDPSTDIQMYFLMASGKFAALPEDPYDHRFMQSTGPFNIAPGEEINVTMAIVMGEGETLEEALADCERNSDWAQKLYDMEYKVFSPPSTPKLIVTPGDRMITLSWDKSAEESSDSFIAGYDPKAAKDFAGYRVYGGKDPVMDSLDKMDNDGDGKVDEDFLAEYPKDNLRYIYVYGDDPGEEVINGLPYYFAVTAYDEGFKGTLGAKEVSLPSLEGSPRSNQQKVVPRSEPAGYIKPDFKISHIGPSEDTGVVNARIAIPAEITGHTYEVRFKRYRGLVYDVVDVTTDEAIYEYIEDLRGGELPVFHGMTLSVTKPSSEVKSVGLTSGDTDVPVKFRNFVGSSPGHTYEIRFVSDPYRYDDKDPLQCPMEVWDVTSWPRVTEITILSGTSMLDARVYEDDPNHGHTYELTVTSDPIVDGADEKAHSTFEVYDVTAGKMVVEDGEYQYYGPYAIKYNYWLPKKPMEFNGITAVSVGERPLAKGDKFRMVTPSDYIAILRDYAEEKLPFGTQSARHWANLTTKEQNWHPGDSIFMDGAEIIIGGKAVTGTAHVAGRSDVTIDGEGVLLDPIALLASAKGSSGHNFELRFTSPTAFDLYDVTEEPDLLISAGNPFDPTSKGWVDVQPKPIPIPTQVDLEEIGIAVLFYPQYGEEEGKRPIDAGDAYYVVTNTSKRLLETGDVYTMDVYGRELTESDVYIIDTSAAKIEATKADLDRIKVVPNPYIINAAWDEKSHEHKITFTHLPAECTIRIYTLAGDLVQELEHSSGEANIRGGTESWDLFSKSGQSVVSGIYIYLVQSDVGNKIGKFAILK